MKDAIILFKFASRSRPHKFKEAMKSITDNLARPELACFMFTFDEDDPTKDQYNVVLDELGKINYSATFGVSESKIHACNRDLHEANTLFPEWKILVCMSDDMEFIFKGFDNTIREAFIEEDLCVHFPDQNQGAKCMTMSIMDRKYFERRKYVYHHDYISVECDLEAQEEAQMLGRYKFMEGQRIFNHNHPSFGQGTYDAQYNKTEAYEVHEADKATRRRRKADNYGLVKTETGWDTPKLIEMSTLEELRRRSILSTEEKQMMIESLQGGDILTTKEKALSILRKAMQEIEAL